MRQKFLDFIEANPSASQSDAAVALGVTRQRISQLCNAEGIKMERPAGGRCRSAPPANKTIMGRDRERFIGTAGNTTIGALCEVAVCADLLDRGIHVFRSMSPDSPCDLVALLGGVPFRVEVKCSRKDRTGNVVRPNSIPERYDVLACVLPGPCIYYFDQAGRWPFSESIAQGS